MPSQGHTQVSLDRLSPSLRKQRLADVRACLERGEDVLFTVHGHCVALTDVRAFADGATRYLVQDPWYGTGQPMTATNVYFPQGA